VAGIFESSKVGSAENRRKRRKLGGADILGETLNQAWESRKKDGAFNPVQLNGD